MRKCDNYLAVSGYRYAPEQFKAYRVTGFSNGNRNVPVYERIKLSYEETSKCGNALCTQGRNAAVTILKKILRERNKKPQYYITIGFMSKTYPTQYRFTQDIRTLPDKLGNRLNVYKEFKKYCIAHDCKFPAYTQAVLDGNYKAKEVVEVYDEIDIKRPVMVKLMCNYN